MHSEQGTWQLRGGMAPGNAGEVGNINAEVDEIIIIIPPRPLSARARWPAASVPRGRVRAPCNEQVECGTGGGGVILEIGICTQSPPCPRTGVHAPATHLQRRLVVLIHRHHKHAGKCARLAQPVLRWAFGDRDGRDWTGSAGRGMVQA